MLQAHLARQSADPLLSLVATQAKSSAARTHLPYARSCGLRRSFGRRLSEDVLQDPRLKGKMAQVGKCRVPCCTGSREKHVRR